MKPALHLSEEIGEPVSKGGARQNAGRKRLPPGQRHEKITITMQADTIELLKAFASSKGASVSGVIESIVVDSAGRDGTPFRKFIQGGDQT